MFSRVMYAIGAARVTGQGVPAAVKGGHARGLNSRLTLEEPRRGLCSGRPVYTLTLPGRPAVDERAPRAGLGLVSADECGALPLGLPPDMRAAGHGGKRLVSGPRPCAGPANMRRGTAQKRGGDYALAGALFRRPRPDGPPVSGGGSSLR